MVFIYCMPCCLYISPVNKLFFNNSHCKQLRNSSRTSLNSFLLWTQKEKIHNNCEVIYILAVCSKVDSFILLPLEAGQVRKQFYLLDVVWEHMSRIRVKFCENQKHKNRNHVSSYVEETLYLESRAATVQTVGTKSNMVTRLGLKITQRSNVSRA